MSVFSTEVRGGSRVARRSFLKPGVLLLSVVNSLWALAGLVANPSFATGDAATSVTVLGIDFNAWHALSGLAVFLPGLYIVRWSGYVVRAYALAMIPAVALPGLWALFDDRPLGLWPFDHAESDAMLHFATAMGYAAVLVLDRRQRWKAAHM